MTYVCPVCQEKYFSTEDAVRKHFLSCWKKKNPCHESKTAPSYETFTRQTNDDVLNFFNSFQEDDSNGD